MPSGSSSFVLRARQQRAQRLATHVAKQLSGNGKNAEGATVSELVANAIADGRVTVCPPKGKRPDMRKRHRGY